MVGTLRSTGCETCRKRKKKCDEERPSCMACVAAGWKCPGYARRWKFVDENNSLHFLYRKKRFGFEAVELGEPDMEQLGQLIHFRKSNTFSAVETFRAGEATVEVGIFWPLTSTSERTGAMLCHILTSTRSQTFLSLQDLGSFFPFIPGRLGRNIALDSSVSCLCSIYRDVLSDRATSHRTIEQYARSLNALQRCIKQPDLRLESETICATILLQLCELMLSPDNGRWNNLSQGSALLIRDGGPERFMGAFERAMLESQRAMFIVQDRNAGRPCFLAESRWRSFLEHREYSTAADLGAVGLRSQLCDFLVDLPEVIDEAVVLVVRPEAGDMSWETRVAGLIGRVSQFKHRMEKWYEHEVIPRLFEPEAPDWEAYIADGYQAGAAIPSPNLSYRGVLYAVLDSVINNVLSQLVKILLTLQLLGREGHTELDWIPKLEDYQRRRGVALSAFRFVKARSKIGAKPLGFGLHQLWISDEALDSALEFRLPGLFNLRAQGA